MKKTILPVLAFMLCQGLAANTPAEQTSEEKETQQQIVDVKMSRKVIYADSYEGKLMCDQAKLRQRNQKKLEYMIRTFLVQDLGLSAEDAQELYDFVDDKLQNVERTIDGATVAHLFSFITKESLVSIAKKKNYDFSGLADYYAHPENYEIDENLQKSLDGLSHTVVFDESKKEEAKAETPKVAEVPVLQPVAETPAVAKEEPVVETPVVAKEEPVVETPVVAKEEPVVETPVVAKEEPVVETPVVAKEEPVVETPAVAKEEPVVETPVVVKEEPVATPAAPAKPALVEELFACGTFGEVTKYLVNKKKNNDVDWGNARVMAAKADKCYIVIIDRSSQKIITILDMGKDTRTNFQTGVQCTDAEFGDASRIYVQPLK